MAYCGGSVVIVNSLLHGTKISQYFFHHVCRFHVVTVSRGWSVVSVRPALTRLSVCYRPHFLLFSHCLSVPTLPTTNSSLSSLSLRCSASSRTLSAPPLHRPLSSLVCLLPHSALPPPLCPPCPLLSPLATTLSLSLSLWPGDAASE